MFDQARGRGFDCVRELAVREGARAVCQRWGVGAPSRGRLEHLVKQVQTIDSLVG